MTDHYQHHRSSHDVARAPSMREDGAKKVARMEALRERFGDAMPPEYLAVEEGENLDLELLHRWYETQPLKKGGADFLDSNRLVGVYIDTTDDSQPGTNVEHTRVYHHFSDAERAMIRSTKKGQVGSRISFGSALPANTMPEDRRIDLQIGDGVIGSRNSIPEQHVQFGGHDGKSAVRDVGNFGQVTLVFERPKDQHYLHEHFPDRTVDVAATSEIKPHTQAEIAHVVAAVLDGGQLPTDMLAFNQLLNEGAARTQCSRAELQQVLEQLRSHQIHPQGSVLAVQTEGRRNRIIRGIETALNPLMAAATVSAESRSAWRSDAASGDAEKRRALEQRIAIYGSALDALDAEWGTWQSAQAQYITHDQGLRSTFKHIHSVAYLNPREQAQQRQQFFEAYRAWLTDAVKNLERLLVKKSA